LLNKVGKADLLKHWSTFQDRMVKLLWKRVKIWSRADLSNYIL